MTDPRDAPESRAIHEWSNNPRNLPTVIFAAPPPEPSVTSGVTGLFVPLFLGLFIILAVYFFAGAWGASQKLLHQQGIARDAAGLTAYIEDLERQNSDLCARLGDLPDRVDRPPIEVQIQSVRRAFDVQCQRNQQLQNRLNGGQGARCVTVTPSERSQPETSQVGDVVRRESVADFRARICRNYQVNTGSRN